MDLDRTESAGIDAGGAGARGVDAAAPDVHATILIMGIDAAAAVPARRDVAAVDGDGAAIAGAVNAVGTGAGGRDVVGIDLKARLRVDRRRSVIGGIITDPAGPPDDAVIAVAARHDLIERRYRRCRDRW